MRIHTKTLISITQNGLNSAPSVVRAAYHDSVIRYQLGHGVGFLTKSLSVTRSWSPRRRCLLLVDDAGLRLQYITASQHIRPLRLMYSDEVGLLIFAGKIGRMAVFGIHDYPLFKGTGWRQGHCGFGPPRALVKAALPLIQSKFIYRKLRPRSPLPGGEQALGWEVAARAGGLWRVKAARLEASPAFGPGSNPSLPSAGD